MSLAQFARLGATYKSVSSFERSMKKFVIVLIVLAILGIAGGVVFLGTWELPPPTKAVEKTIPNDRFAR